MTKQELMSLLREQFEKNNVRCPESINNWWGSYVRYSYGEDNKELIEEIAEAIMNKIKETNNVHV